jgi:transcriptional regulator with XRE-family HTH domain
MALPDSNISTVQVDGAVVGSFTDYDSLIEQLRARISAVGLSYATLEDLVGMCDGTLGKYLSDVRVRRLSIESFLKISEAVGVRGVLVTDDTLLRKYRPLYENRDSAKAHPRRRARLGDVTLKRVLPAAAAELGRRGAAARNAALPAEVRRELARAAARARWKGRRPRPGA